MAARKQNTQNVNQNANMQENTNEQFANAEVLYRFHPQYGFIPHSPNQQFAENQMGQSQPGFPQYGNPWPHNAQHFHHQAMGYGAGQFGYGHPHLAMQAQVDFLTQQLQQMMQLQANNNFSGNSNNRQANLNMENMNEIYNTVDDVMNGKASPNKLFSLLQGISGDFWKGFAIGIGILLLYNYSPLKEMLASGLGGLLSNFAAGEQEFAPEFDEPTEEENENQKN